ncbi:hypothetical protein HK104_010656 [Borealophlyctis nickersoniae]|nr:hypothetical protein HK104_010656 [Borealophlyctis nickersoniae]
MFMSIAELIQKLPDDTVLISLEDQLLHHIAESNDGALAYHYNNKLIIRQQKIMVQGMTEEGKALALAVLRKWGNPRERPQKLFVDVRNGDKNASKSMQDWFARQLAKTGSTTGSATAPEQVEIIKKMRPNNMTFAELIDTVQQVNRDDLNKVTLWYKNKNGGSNLYKIWNGLCELFKGDTATILAEWDKAELRRETITGNCHQVFNRVVSVDQAYEKLEKGGLHFHRHVAALRMALLWFNALNCGKELSEEERAQLKHNEPTRFRNIYCLVYGIEEGDDDWLPGLGLSILASNTLTSTMLRDWSLDSVRLILAVRAEVEAVGEVWAGADEKMKEVEKLVRDMTDFVDNKERHETFNIKWAKLKGGGGGGKRKVDNESTQKKKRKTVA